MKKNRVAMAALVVAILLTAVVPAEGNVLQAQEVSPVNLVSALVIGKDPAPALTDTETLLPIAEAQSASTTEEKRIKYTWPVAACGGWHVGTGGSRSGSYLAQNNGDLDASHTVADCHFQFPDPIEGWTSTSLVTEWWASAVDQDTATRRVQMESLGLIPLYGWFNQTGNLPSPYGEWSRVALSWPTAMTGMRLVALGGSTDWIGISDISLTVTYHRDGTATPTPKDTETAGNAATHTPTATPSPTATHTPTATPLPKAVITQFEVAECSVIVGSLLNITWTTENAAQVELKRNTAVISRQTSGLYVDSLNTVGQYTYQLTVLGATGDVLTREIVVAAQPVPPTPTAVVTQQFSTLVTVENGQAVSCKQVNFLPLIGSSSSTSGYSSCARVASAELSQFQNTATALELLPSCQSVEQAVSQIKQFCPNAERRWLTHKDGIVNAMAWNCNSDTLQAAQGNPVFVLELRDVPWDQIGKQLATALTAAGIVVETPVVIAVAAGAGSGFIVYAAYTNITAYKNGNMWKRMENLRILDVALVAGGMGSFYSTPISIQWSGGLQNADAVATWYFSPYSYAYEVQLLQLEPGYVPHGHDAGYVLSWNAETGSSQAVWLSPEYNRSFDTLAAHFAPMNHIEAANWVANWGAGTVEWKQPLYARPIYTFNGWDDPAIAKTVADDIDTENQVVGGLRVWEEDWVAGLPTGKTYSVWRVTSFGSVPDYAGAYMQVPVIDTDGVTRVGTFGITDNPPAGLNILYSGEHPITWVGNKGYVTEEQLPGTPKYDDDHKGIKQKCDTQAECRDAERKSLWNRFFNKDKAARDAGKCIPYELWMRKNIEMVEGIAQEYITYFWLDADGGYDYIGGDGVRVERKGTMLAINERNPTIFGNMSKVVTHADITFPNGDILPAGSPKLFAKSGQPWTLDDGRVGVSHFSRWTPNDPCPNPIDYLPEGWPIVE